MKELEAENAKLKKMFGGLSLENVLLKDGIENFADTTSELADGPTWGFSRMSRLLRWTHKRVWRTYGLLKMTLKRRARSTGFISHGKVLDWSLSPHFGYLIDSMRNKYYNRRMF